LDARPLYLSYGRYACAAARRRFTVAYNSLLAVAARVMDTDLPLTAAAAAAAGGGGEARC